MGLEPQGADSHSPQTPQELQLKDEECERLSKVREQLEQELEELTASLFEEAHRMVREANMKQAASEKQLKEARGKVRSPPLRPSQSPHLAFQPLESALAT